MSVLMFLPKKRASPDVGGRRPINIEIVVLLPAPLCPVKKKDSFQKHNTNDLSFAPLTFELNKMYSTNWLIP